MPFSLGRHARLREQCPLEPHSSSDRHRGTRALAGSSVAYRGQNVGRPLATAAAKQGRVRLIATSPAIWRTIRSRSTPSEANDQHYELPPEFFALMLGPQRKYSCCYYDNPAATLAQAEERALAETAEHAAACRRPTHLGAWLRLGIVFAVDGAKASQCAHCLRIQFTFTTRVHYPTRGNRRVAKSHRARGRHQRVRPVRPIRSGRFSRDVRAYVELARAAETHCLVDDAAGRSLRPHFQSPARSVPLRRRRPGRLDCATFFYRRHHAKPRSDQAVRRSRFGRTGVVVGRQSLPAGRPSIGCKTSTATLSISTGCCGASMATMRRCGIGAGVYSCTRRPACSVTAAASNGPSAIIGLNRRRSLRRKSLGRHHASGKRRRGRRCCRRDGSVGEVEQCDLKAPISQRRVIGQIVSCVSECPKE